VKLVTVGKPEIISITNQNITTSNNNQISDYKLALILAFGILGIIIVLFFYYKVYPKIYNYRRIQIDKKQQKNKVYSVSEKELENVNDEIQKDNSEESRIVEITNEECKL
jgi:amino acid permease